MARRRAPRITASRVSRNPGLYAAVVLERRSPRILGLTALTSSLESACPTGPSSSEADATDVRARRTQGPRQAHRETSFNRLRRGQAVRAHAMHILCRYLREDSPRLFSSYLPRQLRVSLFQCDLLSSATRGSRRIALCRTNGLRAGPFRCRSFSVIFPAIFLRILLVQESNIQGWLNR